MRAALSRERIPMMELLVAYGADVNAAWHGNYPILFAACETLSPSHLEMAVRSWCGPELRERDGMEGARDSTPRHGS